MILLSKTFLSSFLTLIVLVGVLMAVGGVSVVNAAVTCPVPALSGQVSVPHAICSPPGPPPKGRDGLKCIPTGLPSGTSITGICLAGCCTYVNSSSAKGAIKEAVSKAGSATKSALLSQLGQQVFSQLLQKLLGGGGGGGGGGSDAGSQYQSPEYRDGNTLTPASLLTFDPVPSSGGSSFLNDSLLGVFNDGVGTQDSASILGDADITTDTTDTTGDGTQTGSVDTQTNTDSAQSNTTTETQADGTVVRRTQSGDTVVTTFEYTDGTGRRAGDDDVFEVRGDDNFFNDSTSFTDTTDDGEFFRADFDTSDGTFPTGQGGLTRAELEAQGLLEAARRGAQLQTNTQTSQGTPYESLTPAEIRSLRDYNNSSVAVSGRLSPFQDNGENTNGQTQPAEQKEGVFTRVVKFFATLLGFGAPASN